MRLTGLSLRRFRNLGVQDLEIPREGLALVGDNAQGKSSFLEAIYYLETFRSFRGAPDEQLIGFGEDVFRVAGTIETGEDGGATASTITAAYARKGRRKKVTVDGVEPERLADGLGRLAAVIFSPTDIELVSGGPVERRRFLDIVLSLGDPAYLSALQEYRQVLARRNASLKARQAPSVVAAWDPGLVRAGATVIVRRRDWIEAGGVAFGSYYERVSGEGGARMAYRSSVPLAAAGSASEVEASFRAALERSIDRERRLGATVVGPHRDDVKLTLDGGPDSLDLRTYGSGGQRRTAALALRLVEARSIRERKGHPPLVLLDDVFAELDAGRSERVLEVMDSDEVGQVVVTAPKAGDVRVRADALPRWRVRGGRIET